MKASIGIRGAAASFFLIILASACTSAEKVEFKMPTLAVLPSVTVAVETLTPMPTQHPPIVTPAPTITPPATIVEAPVCDIPAWWTAVSPTVVRFFDTWDVASSTPRVSLSPVLLQLREIWQEFERLDYPECASSLRDAIVAGMADAADGFNEFLAQNDAASLILERAALRFHALSEQLTQHAITPDSRLSSKIDAWGMPTVFTRTWVFMSADERATAAAATSMARATGLIQGMTMTAAVTEMAETPTPATS